MWERLSASAIAAGKPLPQNSKKVSRINHLRSSFALIVGMALEKNHQLKK
jgi:hypothetical protein